MPRLKNFVDTTDFTKEEILAFPFGSKIYKVLNKLRFYN